MPQIAQHQPKSTSTSQPSSNPSSSKNQYQPIKQNDLDDPINNNVTVSFYSQNFKIKLLIIKILKFIDSSRRL